MTIGIDELDRLEKEATQGEWHFSTDPYRVGEKFIEGTRKVSLMGNLCIDGFAQARDLEFIAALVNWYRSGGREMVRDGERYRKARDRNHGVCFWTEFAKPLWRYQEAADEALDKELDTARRTSGDERG